MSDEDEDDFQFPPAPRTESRQTPVFESLKQARESGTDVDSHGSYVNIRRCFHWRPREPGPTSRKAPVAARPRWMSRRLTPTMSTCRSRVGLGTGRLQLCPPAGPSLGLRVGALGRGRSTTHVQYLGEPQLRSCGPRRPTAQGLGSPAGPSRLPHSTGAGLLGKGLSNLNTRSGLARAARSGRRAAEGICPALCRRGEGTDLSSSPRLPRA
ncbi:uncharacterized protein [Lepidochelys kempii]|uniref:uncharacterized protein isoform X2 n=1 Tax=Lepidochelys kempii TaxID=8472 RepID=UPI003C6F6453